MIAPEVMTPEDVKAYNELLAIQHGPNHHRFKMRKIADRSRSASVGRALNGVLHLRLDEVGNPEIVYNKSKVIARFVVGGIKLYVPRGVSYDRNVQNIYSQSLSLYTSFTMNGNVLTPSNLRKQADEAGYIHHDDAFRYNRCKCSVCEKYVTPWQTETQVLNDQYKAYTDTLLIRGTSDEFGGIDFPVAPYDDSKEMSKLLPLVENEWQKVTAARDWNRRKYA